ncbi:MAG: hypothetical protein HYW27_03910 [Candidatus Aenigmarchaeota archaeon]|nr:hypothetical protein [Candidatus Aenigmarchaeota archaeon]
MNTLDRIMVAMIVLFLGSIASTIFMWSPMHHLGMGFIWLAFIVVVVIIMTNEVSGEKPRKRRKR